jgi:hypothetical protein
MRNENELFRSTPKKNTNKGMGAISQEGMGGE